MRYGKVNWIQLSFEELKDEHGEAFGFSVRTLAPIEESIKSSLGTQKHINEEHQILDQIDPCMKDEEWESSVTSLGDDFAQQQRLIDEMLGVSFVVCQVYLSQSEQAFAAVDAVVLRVTGAHLSCLNREKDKDRVRIFSQGPKFAQTTYTYAQIVNAAANYYKHRAEWNEDWLKLTAHQLKTADVIMELGARPNLSNNLSTLARVLGNQNLFEVDGFLKGIRKWEVEIIKEIEIELRQRNLLGNI